MIMASLPREIKCHVSDKASGKLAPDRLFTPQTSADQTISILLQRPPSPYLLFHFLNSPLWSLLKNTVILYQYYSPHTQTHLDKRHAEWPLIAALGSSVLLTMCCWWSSQEVCLTTCSLINTVVCWPLCELWFYSDELGLRGSVWEQLLSLHGAQGCVNMMLLEKHKHTAVG